MLEELINMFFLPVGENSATPADDGTLKLSDSCFNGVRSRLKERNVEIASPETLYMTDLAGGDEGAAALIEGIAQIVGDHAALISMEKEEVVKFVLDIPDFRAPEGEAWFAGWFDTVADADTDDEDEDEWMTLQVTRGNFEDLQKYLGVRVNSSTRKLGAWFAKWPATNVFFNGFSQNSLLKLISKYSGGP
jgi:hypothetical protein